MTYKPYIVLGGVLSRTQILTGRYQTSIIPKVQSAWTLKSGLRRSGIRREVMKTTMARLSLANLKMLMGLGKPRLYLNPVASLSISDNIAKVAILASQAVRGRVENRAVRARRSPTSLVGATSATRHSRRSVMLRDIGVRRMARTRLSSSVMNAGGCSTGRTRSRGITRCMKGRRMLQEGINQKHILGKTKSRRGRSYDFMDYECCFGQSTYMTS